MPCTNSRPADLIRNVKENSKRNGFKRAVFGTHWYPKDKYIGEWKNDLKEGKGIEISRDGYIHKGEWINGMKEGFGMLSKMLSEKCSQSRKILHLGYWLKGKKHGYGLHWYTNSFYKGCFKDDKKCGFGEMWWYCGQYYEGLWENDKFHGKGTLYLTNCNVYEGQFVDGKKEGYGIYYHKNTGQIQCGYWRHDLCINSTMEDAYFRQSSLNPTPYPITNTEETFSCQ